MKQSSDQTEGSKAGRKPLRPSSFKRLSDLGTRAGREFGLISLILDYIQVALKNIVEPTSGRRQIYQTVNPFTSKSDQFQISPTAAPEI